MIIITGSNGFIGKNLERFLPRERIFRLKSDIRNYISIANQMKYWSANPKRIVHLAALTDAQESIVDPINYAETNLMGTINLLEIMRKFDIEKIIFASSAAVKDVQNPYGLSKLHAEDWIKMYGELYGLKYVILRIYNVYGPKNNKGVVYYFMKNLKENRPLTIYGGKQIRDFVYVDDVCKAIRLVLDEKLNWNTTYSIGTGIGTSIGKLAQMLQKITGIKAKIDRKPAKNNEIWVSVCTKKGWFQTYFNFTPLKEGLKKYWEAFP